MKLFLAPMEGVTDHLMRNLLTKQGGIDYCVTEFLRVTKTLHPKKVFLNHCPELLTKSKTQSGVPVFLQLLGGDPFSLSDNAGRAVELGAAGIDLNFGCPAKTVNRHDGGAVLLKYPSRLFNILKKVRDSVPKNIPVSGKIRLGFEDASACIENTQALQEAGAHWITVHCRTKLEGYRPPAHWSWIPRIMETVSVPIIVNGDIQCLNSFFNCLNETKANHYMIGRASLTDPFLFNKIKSTLAHLSNHQSTYSNANPSSIVNTNNSVPSFSYPSFSTITDSHQFNPHPLSHFFPSAPSPSFFNDDSQEWKQIQALLHSFFHDSQTHINGHFATSRTKQWLKYLSLKRPQAKILFDKIKTTHNPIEFKHNLDLLLNRSTHATQPSNPNTNL